MTNTTTDEPITPDPEWLPNDFNILTVWVARERFVRGQGVSTDVWVIGVTAWTDGTIDVYEGWQNLMISPVDHEPVEHLTRRERYTDATLIAVCDEIATRVDQTHVYGLTPLAARHYGLAEGPTLINPEWLKHNAAAAIMEAVYRDQAAYMRETFGGE